MLKLGTVKVDITPRHPVPLAGFSDRSGVFDRVRHPIHARALCFESEANGAPARSLFVSADLIWWGSERIDPLRQRIRERCGIEESAILLHATHSHSGPQTTTLFAPSLGLASPGYIALLEDRVVEAAARAMDSLEPVTIESGSGSCAIGIHRRRDVNGRIEMAPNPSGPNDPECIVIRFQTLSNKAKALLVHFTCHPTTTAANELSPEYPGLAMQELEEAANESLVAVFAQGCCGDVRPALIRGDAFYRGGDNEVRALASSLAHEVRRVLDTPMNACPATDPGVRKERLQLGFEEPQPKECPWLEVTWLELAENLKLVGFNAEMVVQYGLFIKESFGGRVLPLGYTNGMIGYVTTAQQLAQGGYEPCGSTPYFNLPAPFAAGTEARIRRAILNTRTGSCLTRHRGIL